MERKGSRAATLDSADYLGNDNKRRGRGDGRMEKIAIGVCVATKGKKGRGGREETWQDGEARSLDRFPVFDNVDSGGGTEEPEIPWR